MKTRRRTWRGYLLELFCRMEGFHRWTTPAIIGFRPPKVEPLTDSNMVPHFWRFCSACGRHEIKWADEKEWEAVSGKQIPIDL